MRQAIAIGCMVLVLSACGARPAVLPSAPVAAAAQPQDTQAQALFDRRVVGLANDIVAMYDHNDDGKIDLRTYSSTATEILKKIGELIVSKFGGTFRIWPDERVRSVTNTYNVGDKLTVTTRVYTRAPLFYSADANHDMTLTYEELRQFIGQQYDTNGDGVLDAKGLAFWREKNELERFNADYGEQLISYQDIDRPLPAKPATNTPAANAPPTAATPAPAAPAAARVAS